MINFLTAVANTGHGQVVLTNILHTFEQSVDEEEKSALRSLLQTGCDKVSLDNIVDDVVKQFIGVLLTAAEFRFIRQQKPLLAPDTKLCTTLNLNDNTLVETIVRKSVLRQAGIGINANQPLTDTQIRQLMVLKDRAALSANQLSDWFDPDAKLGWRYNIFWATSEDISDETYAPDAIRDVLGLIHHGESTPLFVVAFRANAFIDNDGYNFAAPSVIEGADQRRFKYSCTCKGGLVDNYGRTLDLEAYANTGELIDGATELVLEALSVNHIEKGVYKERVKMTRDQTDSSLRDADDAKFALHLSRGLSATPETLARQVYAHLQ